MSSIKISDPPALYCMTTLNGTRTICLALVRSEGQSGIFSSAQTVAFEIEGKKGYVKLQRSGATEVTYMCTFDGKPISEQGHASSAAAGSGSAVKLDGTGSKLKINVIGHVVALDSNGKKVRSPTMVMVQSRVPPVNLVTPSPTERKRMHLRFAPSYCPCPNALSKGTHGTTFPSYP